MDYIGQFWFCFIAFFIITISVVHSEIKSIQRPPWSISPKGLKLHTFAKLLKDITSKTKNQRLELAGPWDQLESGLDVVWDRDYDIDDDTDEDDDSGEIVSVIYGTQDGIKKSVIRKAKGTDNDDEDDDDDETDEDSSEEGAESTEDNGPPSLEASGYGRTNCGKSFRNKCKQACKKAVKRTCSYHKCKKQFKKRVNKACKTECYYY